MKKRWLYLMLCLLLAANTVFAEDAPAVLADEFDNGVFTVTLPEGDWYAAVLEDGSTYYYGDENCSLDHGMINFVLERETGLGNLEMTDELLDMLYGNVAQSMASASVDGKYGQEDSEIAGHRSILFWYRAEMSGLILSVGMDMVVVGDDMFAIMYSHPDLSPEEVKDVVKEMSAKTVYAGDSAGDSTEGSTPGSASAAAPFDYSMATEEEPHSMAVSFVAGRDMNAAMWMMNEESRAALTMLLSMDLYFTEGLQEDPEYDLFSQPSYVGSLDDTVCVITPVKTGEMTLVMLFDTAAETACYYFTEWNEEALERLQETYSDQFYENSTQALTDYVVQMQQAIDEYTSGQNAE